MVNTIDSIMDQLILQEDGCWTWPKYLRPNGYANVYFGGKRKYVHRLIFEHVYGPIPEGLEPDHCCLNKACAHPDHLELVTHQENCVRRQTTIDPSRTHCTRGHDWNENRQVTSQGRQRCRSCAQDALRRYAARKMAGLQLLL